MQLDIVVKPLINAFCVCT